VTYCGTLPVPRYMITPRKVSPGRQFTGKNPFRSAAARSGWIFAGKLLAKGDFFGKEGGG